MLYLKISRLFFIYLPSLSALCLFYFKLWILKAHLRSLSSNSTPLLFLYLFIMAEFFLGYELHIFATFDI